MSSATRHALLDLALRIFLFAILAILTLKGLVMLDDPSVHTSGIILLSFAVLFAIGMLVLAAYREGKRPSLESLSPEEQAVRLAEISDDWL